MGMTGQVGVVAGVILIQLVGTEGYKPLVRPAAVGLVLVLPFLLTLREVPKPAGRLRHTFSSGGVVARDKPAPAPHFALALAAGSWSACRCTP